MERDPSLQFNSKHILFDQDARRLDFYVYLLSIGTADLLRGVIEFLFQVLTKLTFHPQNIVSKNSIQYFIWYCLWRHRSQVVLTDWTGDTPARTGAVSRASPVPGVITGRIGDPTPGTDEPSLVPAPVPGVVTGRTGDPTPGTDAPSLVPYVFPCPGSPVQPVGTGPTDDPRFSL